MLSDALQKTLRALALFARSRPTNTRATKKLSDAQFHVHEVTQHAVGDGDVPQQPRRRAVNLRRLSNPRHGLREDPRRRLAKFPRSRPELRRGPPRKRQRGARPRAVERRLAQQLEVHDETRRPLQESSCAVGTFPVLLHRLRQRVQTRSRLSSPSPPRNATPPFASPPRQPAASQNPGRVLKRNLGLVVHECIRLRACGAAARAARTARRRAASAERLPFADTPPPTPGTPRAGTRARPGSEIQTSRSTRPRSRTGTRLRLSVSRHRRARGRELRELLRDGRRREGGVCLAPYRHHREPISGPGPARHAAAPASARPRRRRRRLLATTPLPSSSSLVSLSALDLGEPLGELSSCLSAHVCASFWPSSKSSLSLYGSGG